MENDCCMTRGNSWFRYRAAALIIEEGCVLFAGNDQEEYLYSVGGGVHMGETAEEAVLREVREETGISYEIDRLAVIHENFWDGHGAFHGGLDCHEIAFYFLMKPKGRKEMFPDGTTLGSVREFTRWIPIEELDRYTCYPSFLKQYLQEKPEGIVHIVTDERNRKDL